MGESRGSPVCRGVDRIPPGGAVAGQDLGASRKRKAAVMSEDSSNLVGNGEHLEVAYEDSQKLLMEIEDLKAQIDKDVKELGYCEANEKLTVELVQKAEQMQCLKKQNEEVQGNNDGMRKQNEKLQAKNDGLAKQNKELQAKNDDLVKENEELRTNKDSMRKQNGEL
ncbi:uncharacterized protein PFB0765w-like [Setaria italica]|uniref:uncharacterized protein PFB0765w-like n=1 Tax=Setaria italica TaxID=4555 RepID=UPI000BE61E74|nr:uncharacterized protein PFB0765w-like [Setaria italica]